jgi:hypothetical protein
MGTCRVGLGLDLLWRDLLWRDLLWRDLLWPDLLWRVERSGRG